MRVTYIGAPGGRAAARVSRTERPRSHRPGPLSLRLGRVPFRVPICRGSPRFGAFGAVDQEGLPVTRDGARASRSSALLLSGQGWLRVPFREPFGLFGTSFGTNTAPMAFAARRRRVAMAWL